MDALRSPGEHGPQAVAHSAALAMRASRYDLLGELLCEGSGLPAPPKAGGHGPLADRYGDWVDPGAWRVLHRGRSAEVLSSLDVREGLFHVRMAARGVVGETADILWQVRRVQGGCWRVAGARRDASEDASALPYPIPGAGPERALRSFLAALQEGRLELALTFVAAGAELDIPNMSRAGFSTYKDDKWHMVAQKADSEEEERLLRFRKLITSPAYHVLVEHEQATVIGSRFHESVGMASAPGRATQRLEAEVVVSGYGAPDVWDRFDADAPRPRQAALMLMTLRAGAGGAGWRLEGLRRQSNYSLGDE